MIGSHKWVDGESLEQELHLKSAGGNIALFIGGDD